MRIPVHRLITAAVLLCGTTAHALGLGDIGVQSALGQPLRASIGLLGADSGDLTDSCIKVRVESLDGVSLANPQLAITRIGPSSSIALTSRHAINEPVANIVVEAGCTSPVRRSYQVLFDPPMFFATASPEIVPARLSGVEREPGSAMVQPDLTGRKTVAQAASPARIKSRPGPAPAAKKPASPKLAATVNLANSNGAAADVLRLSGDDDDEAFSRLMLSSVLTLPADAASQPLSEETRLAQLEFAAILRGEDPRAGIDVQSKAVRAQDVSLRAQMAALQRQNSANQAALAALQTRATLTYWLSGLLMLCLFAIGWLVWRLRSFIRNDGDKPAWWMTSQLDQENQDAGQIAASETIAPEPGRPISVASPPASESAHALPQNVYLDIAPDPELPVSQYAPGAGAKPELPEEVGSANLREGSNEFKLEEITDVTQEAEFWISLNNPRRAIELLERYTEGSHIDSPVTWLYLLDLYREVEEEEKFNVLRQRFTRLFNARIPSYGEPELQTQTLEDFPHLLERICKLWSSGDVIPFLQSLLIDDREGARAGFDLPLYRDILLLLGITLEKKRLNQLEASFSGLPPVASPVSAEMPVPVIETILDAESPSLDNGIDFEPIDFNFESDLSRTK